MNAVIFVKRMKIRKERSFEIPTNCQYQGRSISNKPGKENTQKKSTT
jgi:hypothetical protein